MTGLKSYTWLRYPKIRGLTKHYVNNINNFGSVTKWNFKNHPVSSGLSLRGSFLPSRAVESFLSTVRFSHQSGKLVHLWRKITNGVSPTARRTTLQQQFIFDFPTISTYFAFNKFYLSQFSAYRLSSLWAKQLTRISTQSNNTTAK